MIEVKSPDQVVLTADMTARDVLLMAVKGNLEILAQAVRAGADPDSTFNLHVTLNLRWSPKQALEVLRAGGYEITFPNQGEPA